MDIALLATSPEFGEGAGTRKAELRAVTPGLSQTF